MINTLASNVWPNIDVKFLANFSDFPISVAYKIVHLNLVFKALFIKQVNI